MTREHLAVERTGATAIVTVNRPSARNALNVEIVTELRELVDALAVDADVRVVILTGAGDRAFSSGGDVNWEKQGGLARRHIEIQASQDLDPAGGRLERLVEVHGAQAHGPSCSRRGRSTGRMLSTTRR